MNLRISALLAIVACVAATLATAPLAANSPANTSAYTFTQIDVPGATTTLARDINNAGQVVGYFFVGVSTQHGFVDTGGSFTQIDVPAASNTEAIGINDPGQIVGTSAGNGSFLDTGGSFTPIAVPGATVTSAFGINNAGQIVGTFFDSAGEHGFVDKGGSFTRIDVPNSNFTLAFGINDLGQIVGHFCASPNAICGFDSSTVHGFLADPVQPLFAGTPGAANCHGQSVSALARKYGGLNGAATALGYPDVSALQSAIMAFCWE